MGRLIARWGYLSAVLFFAKESTGQTNNPYILNGSAFQNTCNCYTLTQDRQFQSGSMWNKNKIDLNQSFTYNFDVFLGCRDQDGADGIVFVLQPIGTSVGTAGEGIGYEGVFPSIGIAIDTYQNQNKGDPPEDNISIHKNGIMRHSASEDLVVPESALPNMGNIEDCGWHKFKVEWNAVTKRIIGSIDGTERVNGPVDLINDVFHGDPMVYWGFTGATGGETNIQQVCTSLTAQFNFPDGQKTCYPTDVVFADQSISFGTIDKWFWDFGDGTRDSVSNVPPHTFPRPGKYDVKLAILGNDGCVSDTFTQTITMGSKPIAKFGYHPAIVCEQTPLTLLDSSTVEFGTINKWGWQVGDSSYTEENVYDVILKGTKTIALAVETIEGCISDSVYQTVSSKPSPVIDLQFSDVCVNEIPSFISSQLDQQTMITNWVWNFGDGIIAQTSTGSKNHQYSKGGAYPVSVTALANNGCNSATISKPINIFQTNANAGNDTVVARNQPFQMSGSGGDIYTWSPASGLSDASIADPVATLQHDAQYVLTVSTNAGCSTSDTLNIKVYAGPELYVPSAFTPNGDGKNDEFKFLAVGMTVIKLFEVYNRFGQVVYSSPDMHHGWDGKIKGTLQPSGVYVWLIRGIDYNGKLHAKKGTVILIR